MGNFIKKRFTEVFHYVSDKPPALFREELGRLLSASYKKSRTNITGRFVADNAFEARRRWEFGAGMVRSDTRIYLYGEIIDAGEKTHLIISVTNPGAPFVLVPAGGRPIEWAASADCWPGRKYPMATGRWGPC